MRWSIAAALSLLIPGLALSIGFHQLIRRPDSLLVDLQRPSLDHAGPPGSRGPGNDLTEVVLPRFETLRRSLFGDGEPRIPFWDDSGFGGRPWIGNPQSGTFYPPIWLAARLGNPSAPTWLSIGHLGWAALGTMILLRRLGGSRLAASISAACFSSAPYLVAHVFEGHYAHIWSVSWYPWAFWAFVDIREERVRGLIRLPPILALSFLPGHPQEWYLLCVALGGWALIDGGHGLLVKRPGVSIRSLFLLGSAFALCGAMVALELVPQFHARHWVPRDGETPLSAIQHYSIRTSNFFQLLNPLALGPPHAYFGRDNYWETLLSFGMIPLLLAIVGGAGRRDRRVSRGFVWLAVLSVVFAAGRRLGLFSLIHLAVPGMSAFRVPARSLFLASLAVSVLAGLGVDEIARAVEAGLLARRLRRGAQALAAIVIGLALIDIASAGRIGLGQFRSMNREAMNNLIVDPSFWGTIGFVMVVFSKPCLGRWGGVGVARALGIGLAIELGILTARVVVVSPGREVLDRPALARVIQDAQGNSTEFGPPRFASQPRILTDLLAARWGVSKTNINDYFQIEHAADLYSELYPYLDPVLPLPGGGRPMDGVALAFHGRLARSVLDQFHVACVMTDRGAPIDTLPKGYRVGDERGGFQVQPNPSALPRAFVVPRAIRIVEPGMSPTVALSRIDLRKFVLLEVDPLPPSDRQGFTPARWVASDARRVTVEVTTEWPGLLVVGNTWMPGWRALVNGESRPVLRGNHWQQVVPLGTGGCHRVELIYEPPGFTLGCYLSAVGWIGWALGLAYSSALRQELVGAKSGSGDTATPGHDACG